MDDLMTRCETLAYRLERPHSPFVDEAAAKHLREAAARIAALVARVKELEADARINADMAGSIIAAAEARVKELEAGVAAFARENARLQCWIGRLEGLTAEASAADSSRPSSPE